jgi:hypothetical protein
MAVPIGTRVPPVPGAEVSGPHALVFYKVTCSVTEMAGGPLARLGSAYPGAVVGVGQDPPAAIDRFASSLGWVFPQVEDAPPYVASDAYGVTSAPTVVVVDGDGVVAAVAESWDRDAMNAASAALAGLLRAPAEVLSTEGDGLPAFKPG